MVGDLINSPFVVFNLICLASEQDFLTLFLKIPPFVTLYSLDIVDIQKVVRLDEFFL